MTTPAQLGCQPGVGGAERGQVVLAGAGDGSSAEVGLELHKLVAVGETAVRHKHADRADSLLDRLQDVVDLEGDGLKGGGEEVAALGAQGQSGQDRGGAGIPPGGAEPAEGGDEVHPVGGSGLVEQRLDADAEQVGEPADHAAGGADVAFDAQRGAATEVPGDAVAQAGGLPPDGPAADGRTEGWRAALAASGRESPELLVGDWSPRSGHEAGRRLLREPHVTAVLAANDQMALGLLRAFTEAGVRVPAEISIAGFDDLPESEFFSPPLTTVRQDFEAVGRQGIDLLLRQMESGGGRTTERRVIQPKLITRQSTAGPPPI